MAKIIDMREVVQKQILRKEHLTPFSYTNRRGRTYYLHVGKTKTGKAKYYCSKKKDGNLLDVVPDGFEIHENPDGLVYLRRRLETLLRESEIHSVERAVKTLTSLQHYEYRIEHDKDAITVFTIANDPQELYGVFAPFRMGHGRMTDEFAKEHAEYQAMLRFRLCDELKRLFNCERFCFLGGVDDWIPLSWGRSLSYLSKTFIPHLGKESFFELM